MSIFHERIKQLKEESGKTQIQIAQDLEITPQTLSYYFNGREPNFDTIIKIANYFDVSIDYLLGQINRKKHENINITDKTGLSEKAIDVLNTLKNYNFTGIIKIINLLIENEKIGKESSRENNIHFFLSLFNFLNIKDNGEPKYLTENGELLSMKDYFIDENGCKIAAPPEDCVASFDNKIGYRLIENALMMEIQHDLIQFKKELIKNEDLTKVEVNK